MGKMITLKIIHKKITPLKWWQKLRYLFKWNERYIICFKFLGEKVVHCQFGFGYNKKKSQ